MRLTVIGMPVTQGNKTAYPFKRKDGKLGVSVREGKGGEKHTNWREAVAAEARRLCFPDLGDPWDMPLVATFTFYLPRPKSAGKKVLFPASRPDSLKLARAVEDALTKIIYTDDSRIVTHIVHKRFAVDSPPRVEIELRPATEADL